MDIILDMATVMVMDMATVMDMGPILIMVMEDMEDTDMDMLDIPSMDMEAIVSVESAVHMLPIPILSHIDLENKQIYPSSLIHLQIYLLCIPQQKIQV